ncbi:MAG: hypothetical protein KM312_11595 [Hydrogenibacillus schlegelii]|uniref:Uncharacterized protein n=1 Tax=Hydrogenibacillus schlegelii TaxID=1484 RepID=A0A947CY24_HYDSH|nr:hypothetical protein [Hydrogenibacillus schlegelii]
MGKWKVTYNISPVAIQIHVYEYTNLGLKFEYDNHGNLCKVVHSVDVSEEIHEHEKVFIKSEEKLYLLWEYINYAQGMPVIIESRTAERLDNHTEPAIGDYSLQGKMVVRKAIEKMLDEDRFLNPPPRLSAWLTLANRARDGSDEEAIRNYYMILEDMEGRPEDGQKDEKGKPKPELELKYVRDFVSHGDCLTNPKLLQYLKDIFNKSVCRFDPQDPEHKNFIKSKREEARKLIEEKINKRLFSNN